MKKLVVLKFGGTSVGSLPRIEKAAMIVKRYLDENYQVIAVVSAMGGYTDELKNMAYQINAHPPKRELDMLLTTGERISCALLGICLEKLSIKALSLTGSQSGIITDDTHGNARIKQIKGERIISALKEYDVVIVAGFQGVSESSKDITSLGRGGSDLTAIALASKFNAALCHIYTDVDGVMTADPRLIEKAQTLPVLSWQEMSHLSQLGAKVMHERACELAHKDQVCFSVVNSLNDKAPSTVIKDFVFEGARVVGITFKENISLLRLKWKEKDFITVNNTLTDFFIKNEKNIFSIKTCEDEQHCLESKSLTDFFQESDLVKFLSETNIRYTGVYCTKTNLIAVVGSNLTENLSLVKKIKELFSTETYFFELSKNSIIVATSMNKEILKKLHAICFP